MGKQAPWPAVDPHALPLGTRVGPWRVTGFRGRGACGTLYRVEHGGRQAAGPFALKLALCPSDPRFEHEAQLLSLIHSPHVPQFIDSGVWEHPSGAYPFLVMQLLDGAPLYEWAARRNPSEAQVAGVLAQVARALEATHAAEALEEVAHRARSVPARPLFVWGHNKIPCVRSPEAAQLAAQWDATSRQTLEQREAEKARAATALERRRRSAFAPAWAAAGAAVLLILVLMLVTVRRPPGEPRTGVWRGSREGKGVSIGDSALSPSFVMPGPGPQGGHAARLARPLPEKPFPGQRQPPCIPRIETALRGACWVALDTKPPCGNNAYEWEGKCYLPSADPPRQPTSSPPQ